MEEGRGEYCKEEEKGSEEGGALREEEQRRVRGNEVGREGEHSLGRQT